MSKDKLFELLDLDPNNQEDKHSLDNDAVIRELQQNPHSAESMYTFSSGQRCYPIHKAIRLGAPLDVVAALCTPLVFKREVGLDAPLEYALKHKAPL
eukprot:13131070-Ditylum_brightwellii.AAC.1